MASASVVRRCLSDQERERLRTRSNTTYAILEWQHRDLASLEREGAIDGHQLEGFDRTLAALLDIQSGCERIKSTPIPRAYGFIANRPIMVYGLLFPLALTETLSSTIIPINVLVSRSFALISEAGWVL